MKSKDRRANPQAYEKEAEEEEKEEEKEVAAASSSLLSSLRNLSTSPQTQTGDQMLEKLDKLRKDRTQKKDSLKPVSLDAPSTAPIVLKSGSISTSKLARSTASAPISATSKSAQKSKEQKSPQKPSQKSTPKKIVEEENSEEEEEVEEVDEEAASAKKPQKKLAAKKPAKTSYVFYALVAVGILGVIAAGGFAFKTLTDDD